MNLGKEPNLRQIRCVRFKQESLLIEAFLASVSRDKNGKLKQNNFYLNPSIWHVNIIGFKISLKYKFTLLNAMLLHYFRTWFNQFTQAAGAALIWQQSDV